MHAAIIAHAIAECPRECCGLLAGSGGEAREMYQLRNLAEGNDFYEIDPVQLLELEFTTLPRAGSTVVAIYHSHPVSEAYPSASDVALAAWPDAAYLICSLAEPAAPVVRGFSIIDEQIKELAMAITPTKVASPS
jgi:proteasome lid subunit RPN8/RPN11